MSYDNPSDDPRRPHDYGTGYPPPSPYGQPASGVPYAPPSSGPPSGQPGPYQQPPQPPQYPTGGYGPPQIPLAPPMPPKKGLGAGKIILIIVAVVVVLCGASVLIANVAAHNPNNAANSGSSPAAQVPGAATTTEASPAPPTKGPAAAQPKQLLHLTGKGIKKSATFTTGPEWVLKYTYDCSKFYGGNGNFQVYEYTDGNISDVLVNELDKKGSDSTPQHDDPGAHYLQMNSECSWTVTVTG